MVLEDSSVNDLLVTAEGLQEFCRSHKWKFCFIGGIAVLRWGETRVTRDIDITLFTGFGNESCYVEELLKTYPGRTSDADEFAAKSRVLLVNSPTGIGIDISLGGLPFEEKLIARSTSFTYAPEIILQTCSAEDLLIMKLFASRALDLRDAEGIALRFGKVLDWHYVESELRPLAELKEEPAILQSLEHLRRL